MDRGFGLTALHMAAFVPRRFLVFEGVVSQALISRFLGQLRAPSRDSEDHLHEAYNRLLHNPSIPKISHGTRLPDCFQPDD